MYVVIPMWEVKSPELYLADRLDLSKMISTCTPRLCALRIAAAISFDVNEYASMRISDLALSSSLTIASVHLPCGLKQTLIGVLFNVRTAA